MKCSDQYKVRSLFQAGILRERVSVPSSDITYAQTDGQSYLLIAASHQKIISVNLSL